MRIVQVTPSEDMELARALLTIQHAAYALEATLIDDDRIPALHENLEDLQAAALLWLVAFGSSRPIGAIAWHEGETDIDIDRLIVAPHAHRRGAGSSLVKKVLQHAGKRPVTVSTGLDNTPATTLYERLGFAHVDDAEPIPGLMVSRYRWVWNQTPIPTG